MVFACYKEKYCKIREKRSFYKGPVLTTGVRRKKPKLKELFNGAKTVSTVAGGGGATPPTQQPHETRKRPFREPSDAGSDDNSFNEMKKIHSDSGKSKKKWGKGGFRRSKLRGSRKPTSVGPIEVRGAEAGRV